MQPIQSEVQQAWPTRHNTHTKDFGLSCKRSLRHLLLAPPAKRMWSKIQMWDLQRQTIPVTMRDEALCRHGQGTAEEAEVTLTWWTTVNSKVSWLLALETDVLARVLFVLYCWVSPQIHSGRDEKRMAGCVCGRGDGGGGLSGTSATTLMEDNLSAGVIT